MFTLPVHGARQGGRADEDLYELPSGRSQRPVLVATPTPTVLHAYFDVPVPHKGLGGRCMFY